MVIVRLWGGIGNQLFQFVFGQYLRYRYGLEVYYDNNSYISIDRLRKGEIDFLDFDILYDNKCSFSRYRGIKNRLLRYFFQIEPRHHFITEKNDLPSIYTSGHLYYFQGYWQDEKYYEWLKNNEASFCIKSKNFPNELESYREVIADCDNSISIHIRRGDYFLPKNIKVYGVCNVRYYNEAITRMKYLSGSSRLFVFTDDPEWVLNNIDLDESSILIENYNISQFAYIELMSLCKHHIISNSSFSWWGAVLNERHDSVVISPDRWTNTSKDTIAKDSWIKIAVVDE